MKHYFLTAVFALFATLAFLHAEPFPLDFVTVGDAGNVADSITKLGAVEAPYQIAKYEVTVAQWCAFLNAVAYKEDKHGLCQVNMFRDTKASSIRCIPINGVNVYTPLPNAEKLPITHIGYNDTLRFCNWYQNGMPTSIQGDDVVAASTERGAYNFTQLEDRTEQVVLSTNALYTLPDEDQWMKAAYYMGGGISSGYWL